MTNRLSQLVAATLAGPGDEVALEFDGREVTWAELADVAARIDAVLDRAGLGKGSRIGFVPRNRPAFAAAMLALVAAERSIVMCYAFQSAQAIASDVAGMNCTAFLFDAQDWAEEIAEALPPVALAITLGREIGAADVVQVVRGAPEGVVAPPVDSAAEPVIELLSSGTTGAPKRVPIAYSTVERAIITNSMLDAGRADQGPGEPGTVNFPFSNISGIYSFLPMAVLRRKVLLLEKFDLDKWVEFVSRHRPKLAIIPPVGIRMMLDREIPADALASVDYVSVGTAAVDPDAHRAFEKTYGVVLLLSYGATEFCGAATHMSVEDYQRFGDAKFGSVGRASGENEIRVIDPGDDRVLPPGELGIIEVKVPFLGDGFIRTTDLGIIDEDGFLFHKGRADGVIVRGGFKIMPAAIERVLVNHPSVAMASVVGVSDRRLGQVPVAMVELLPGAPLVTASDLEQHLRNALPSTNIPVGFIFVDALPRTPSMKIDLKEVRARCEAEWGAETKAAARDAQAGG